MAVLDTNIFIYLAKGSLSRQIVRDIDIAYASITKIEAVGYWKITAVEKDYLEQFFWRTSSTRSQ